MTADWNASHSFISWLIFIPDWLYNTTKCVLCGYIILFSNTFIFWDLCIMFVFFIERDIIYRYTFVPTCFKMVVLFAWIDSKVKWNQWKKTHYTYCLYSCTHSCTIYLLEPFIKYVYLLNFGNMSSCLCSYLLTSLHGRCQCSVTQVHVNACCGHISLSLSLELHHHWYQTQIISAFQRSK